MSQVRVAVCGENKSKLTVPRDNIERRMVESCAEEFACSQDAKPGVQANGEFLVSFANAFFCTCVFLYEFKLAFALLVPRCR